MTRDGHVRGVGRSLIRDALTLAPAGAQVFAAMSLSPGNARSLRAFLAVGFRAVGSEVLIRRSSLCARATSSPT